MRGERQKTACSSAFTSWLMLKTKVFALRENAVLSHECNYFPAFSAFAASPFRWYFNMHFKISWVALAYKFGCIYVFIYSEFKLSQ